MLLSFFASFAHSLAALLVPSPPSALSLPRTGQVDHNIWIGVAYILTQMVAAVLMSCTLVYLLTQPRRASLGVCCKTSDRIYYCE